MRKSIWHSRMPWGLRMRQLLSGSTGLVGAGLAAICAGPPHIGTPQKFAGDSNYNASVYLTYSYQARGWGLTWGGGASFEGEIDDNEDFVDDDFNERDFYQTALTVDIGPFSIGGVFEHFNDIERVDSGFFGIEFGDEHDAWVAGGGIAYSFDAWTFGAQYSYGHRDFERSDDFSFDEQIVTQRAVLTANYAFGPGINIDGEVAYTWVDTDPEGAQSFFADDYDGLEIGIGTAIAF